MLVLRIILAPRPPGMAQGLQCSTALGLSQALLPCSSSASLAPLEVPLMCKTDLFLQGVLLTVSPFLQPVPAISRMTQAHCPWFMSQPQHWWCFPIQQRLGMLKFWFSLWWQFSFYPLYLFSITTDFWTSYQADTGCSLEVNLWFNFRLVHNWTVFCNCIFYLYLLLLETQTVQ